MEQGEDFCSEVFSEFEFLLLIKFLEFYFNLIRRHEESVDVARFNEEIILLWGTRNMQIRYSILNKTNSIQEQIQQIDKNRILMKDIWAMFSNKRWTDEYEVSALFAGGLDGLTLQWFAYLKASLFIEFIKTNLIRMRMFGIY